MWRNSKQAQDEKIPKRSSAYQKILGNLSTGRFRGNGNFSDRNSLGRERRRSRQNINVKQPDEFCSSDAGSKLCSLLK